MAITFLDSFSAINLATIRTINFQLENEIVAATVHFMGSTSEPTHYEGMAAKRLFDIVGGSEPPQELRNEGPAFIADEQPSEDNVVTAFEIQPKMRNKAWYYLKREDSRDFFLAFVNKTDKHSQQTSTSMRTFNAQTGKPYGQTDYPAKKLPFQEAYANIIAKCQAEPLHVPYQPNLVNAMQSGLPVDILAHLRSQIK